MNNLRCYKWLIVLAIIALVLSACGPAAPKPTDTPQATQTALPEPTQTALPPATPTPEPPKNLVQSLEDVKKATIQIQAEGTFIDPQVGMVVNGAGRGSGFIIDPSGIAITNNHVVTGAALLKVWVGGDQSKTYSATVLGVSECSDLAVIKLKGSDFPYLEWHSGAPKVGLEVYAAGFPLGDPEFTLTKGIVSKEKASGNTYWASIENVIEHDARINPGNSGGPLVDKDGKVVGINFSGNSENQYFAIARAEADDVINTLKEGTDVTSIGVNGQVVTSDDGTISGVWVSSVKSGSPADKSGVKAGDIITQLEGLVLGTDGTMSDYCQILRTHKASDTLSLNVLRWTDQEFLEGQLNGRQLSVTGTFNTGGNQGNEPQPTSGTVTIVDDTNTISMEVPSSWEYSGGTWQDTWTVNGVDHDFTAATLSASPDMNTYNQGWGMRGIFVAVSPDWGKIGGYANLLQGVAGFYTDCTPATAQSYSDGAYEGQAMVYTNCGAQKAGALVMAVREVNDPQAYLALFELKFTSPADLDELDTILSTVVFY
jgi:serine protease Do